MEESPIVENIDTREWAKQIREMKIHELELLIAHKEEYLKEYDPEQEDYMSYKRVHALSDISRLKRKLEALKNTK